MIDGGFSHKRIYIYTSLTAVIEFVNAIKTEGNNNVK